MLGIHQFAKISRGKKCGIVQFVELNTTTTTTTTTTTIYLFKVDKHLR